MFDAEKPEPHPEMLIIIKICAMLVMFLMIMVMGNLPLKWERFRKSSRIISLSSAFSGGLFLCVGVLHLIPEADESFEAYYKVQGTQEDEHFPWVNFITVTCFAFVLFIEKIAFAHFTDEEHEHGDETGDHDHAHIPVGLKKNDKGNSHLEDEYQDTSAHKDTVVTVNTGLLQNQDHHHDEELRHSHHHDGDSDAEQERVNRKNNSSFRLAKKARNSFMAEHSKEKKISYLTPFILQIAIGIHATFEGMAIGIDSHVPSCLGITLAVVCHKWAEGLTLGLAFFKADVDIKMAMIMISIQAIMNPIGIAIGWVLSSQGHLITGIFQSVSAGTFLYIATAEVISHEFNLKRYRYIKFGLFLCAIGFVTSLYFIEQATGG